MRGSTYKIIVTAHNEYGESLPAETSVIIPPAKERTISLQQVNGPFLYFADKLQVFRATINPDMSLDNVTAVYKGHADKDIQGMVWTTSVQRLPILHL